jgi:hypothetical protein
MVSFTDVCGPIFAASRRADGRPRALQGGQYREGGIRTLVPGDPDNRFSRPAHDAEMARGVRGFDFEGTKKGTTTHLRAGSAGHRGMVAQGLTAGLL